MTPNHDPTHDTLRDVLRHEADDVTPSGSFADVRARARTLDRRARLAKAGAALASVALVVGIAVPLLGDDDTSQVDVTGPTTSAPTDTTTGPSSTTTAPDPSRTPDAPSGSPGIWPFTNGTEADEGDARFADPVETATAYLTEVLGFSNLEASAFQQGDARSGEVVVTTRPRGPETIVLLRLLGSAERWSVIAVTSSHVTIDSPSNDDEVGSSISVRGRASAFEGTVNLDVMTREATPEVLLSTFATGEQGELRPYLTDVELPVTTPGALTVVARLYSAEDGSVDAAAAVPVRHVPANRPPPAPVALPAGEPLPQDHAVVVAPVESNAEFQQQAVIVVDASGNEVRRLRMGDTVEGGFLALELTADRRTVLVAESTSACGSRIVAIPADGSAGEVDLGPGDDLELSPNGRELAVAVDTDCDSSWSIEFVDLATGSRDPARRFGDEGQPLSGIDGYDPDSQAAEYAVIIDDMAWAGDRLIFEVLYEDGTELHRLDLRSGQSDELTPPEAGRRWLAPAVDPLGGVTVVETCCDDVDPTEARLLQLDPIDGVVRGEITTLETTEVHSMDWATGGGGHGFVLTRGGDLFRVIGADVRQENGTYVAVAG